VSGTDTAPGSSEAARAGRRRTASADDGSVAGCVERLVDEAVGKLVVLAPHSGVQHLGETVGEVVRFPPELAQSLVLHLVWVRNCLARLRRSCMSVDAV
jgi:hypothetical protein